MDIICLLETYFYCSIYTNNDTLEFPGYNLVRSDHPLKNKGGGVFIYYKHCCPLESSMSVFCRNA